MYSYNIITFILITVFTVAILLFSIKNESSHIRKIMFIFITISIYIYSGVGIAMTIVDVKFVFYYFIFLSTLILTIKICMNLNFSRKGLYYKSNHSQSYEFYKDINSDHKIFYWFTILFFLTLLINFIFPTFRILDLFNPGKPSSVYIYLRRSEQSSHFINRISGMINNITTPFFFVYLYSLLINKKKFKVFFLIVLWAYIEYMIFNYLGRYNILTYILFVYSVLFFIHPKGIKVSQKQIIGLIVIIFATLPLLFSYMSLRLGTNVIDVSFLNSLQLLFESETHYPQYYKDIENFAGEGSIITFLSWIILLPIPSVLLPTKPAITTNYLFTYKITGLVYGAQDYYSSMLPSVLGEGFIIWGMKFYWVHAIIIGLVISIGFKYIEKYKSFTVMYLYLVIMLLVLGRGGASSYLPQIINFIFPMFIFIKLTAKKKQNKF